MHLFEGILISTPHGREVILVGAAATAAGALIGLRKLDYEQIPRVAVFTSAFFVISSIQIPLGPTTVHLVLAGLMGLLLGWAVFPAVLTAVLLQQVLVHPELGLTTIGVNTVIMAVPGVLCYFLFRRAVCSSHEAVVFVVGFTAGATAILLGALIGAGSLATAGKPFELLGGVFAGVNLMLATGEGFVTGSVVLLLRKVRPELLDAPLLTPCRSEVPHG